MSFSSKPYSVSPELKFAHSFSQGYSYSSQDSITSAASNIIGAPIVITLIGLVCIIGFVAALIFNCCCPVCNPFRPVEDSVKNITRRRNLIITMVIIVILFLVADQFTLVGNSKYISKGFDSYYNDVNFFKTLLQTLSYNLDMVLVSGNQLGNEWQNLQSSCLSLYQGNATLYSQILVVEGAIDADFSTLLSAVQTLQSLINGALPKINDLTDILHKNLIKPHEIPFYVVWGCGLVTGILLLSGSIAKNKKLLEAAIGIGVVAFIVQVVLLFFWMALSSVLGIICDPTPINFISNLFPAESNARNITLYYGDCSGSSPVSVAINQGIAALTDMSSYATDLEQLCSTDPSFLPFVGNASSVIQIAETTLNLVDCPNVTPTVQEFLETAVCGNLFNGIFMIWVSQIVTTFLMFIGFILAFYLAPLCVNDSQVSSHIDALSYVGSQHASAPAIDSNEVGVSAKGFQNL